MFLSLGLSGTEVKPLQSFGSVIWQPALKQSPVVLLEFLFICSSLAPKLSLNSTEQSNLSRRFFVLVFSRKESSYVYGPSFIFYCSLYLSELGLSILNHDVPSTVLF